MNILALIWPALLSFWRMTMFAVGPILPELPRYSYLSVNAGAQCYITLDRKLTLVKGDAADCLDAVTIARDTSQNREKWQECLDELRRIIAEERK